MPISYDYDVFLIIKNIENRTIKSFLMKVIQNGSFQKKGVYQNNSVWKSSLDVGIDIYYTKNGSDVVVQEVVVK